MDLQYLKKIIKIVNESGIEEVEIEEEGTKVRISARKNSAPIPQTFFAPYPPQSSAAHPEYSAPAVSTGTPAVEKPIESVPSAKMHEVKSPIVGTFYRAPAPDADSYVQVGQTVSKGTVLCIIEAMKLMNEIESDADGKIVQILVDNGKPVEYNQTLFLIEPA